VSISLNLENVEAWTGSVPPPPGQHVFRIDEATEGTSSGGHDQLEVSLRVESGDSVGATMRDWIVITPATLGKVRQFLEATEVEIPPGEFALPTSRLPGRLVKGTVRLEERDGKTRARLVAYEPSGRPATTGSNGGGFSAPTRTDADIPF
jgi:hypothetical protein